MRHGVAGLSHVRVMLRASEEELTKLGTEVGAVKLQSYSQIIIHVLAKEKYFFFSINLSWTLFTSHTMYLSLYSRLQDKFTYIIQRYTTQLMLVVYNLSLSRYIYTFGGELNNIFLSIAVKCLSYIVIFIFHVVSNDIVNSIYVNGL